MRWSWLRAIGLLCLITAQSRGEDRCPLECLTRGLQLAAFQEEEREAREPTDDIEDISEEGIYVNPRASSRNVWGPGSLSRDTTQSTFPKLPGLRGVRGLTGVIGNLLAANPHAGATWYPDQAVSGQPARLGMTREFFQFTAPVWSNGKDALMFSSHVQATTIRTSAVLPQTMQPIPDRLWNIWIGGNYFHTCDNGWIAAALFEGGSASDKPFSAARNDSAAGTGLLIIPNGDRDAWIVGLQASTNSQVFYNLPIPGGAYLYNPNEDFQAILGFPYTAINYRVLPQIQLQFLYMFVTTVHARAAYQPADDRQFYVGFDWANENYSIADRQEANSRFYYYEKRAVAGWQWWWTNHWAVELAGGYAFERYFVEANESNFLGQGNNRVNVAAGPFATVQLDYRF